MPRLPSVNGWKPRRQTSVRDRSGRRLRRPIAGPIGELRSVAGARTPAARRSRGTALRPATFKYQLVLTDAAEMQAPESVTDKLTDQGSSDVWDAGRVALRIGGAQAPGIDEPELDIDQRMVVARYGDDWKVVGDLLWSVAVRRRQCYKEFAGLRVADVHTAGGTSVIASCLGTADLVDRARGLLPDAVQAVESFWGSQWPRRVAVVTTGRPDSSPGCRGAEADGAAAAATVFTGIDADKTVGASGSYSPNARRSCARTGRRAAARDHPRRNPVDHLGRKRHCGSPRTGLSTSGARDLPSAGRRRTDLAAAVGRARHPPLPTDADFAVSGRRPD